MSIWELQKHAYACLHAHMRARLHASMCIHSYQCAVLEYMATQSIYDAVHGQGNYQETALINPSFSVE